MDITNMKTLSQTLHGSVTTVNLKIHSTLTLQMNMQRRHKYRLTTGDWERFLVFSQKGKWKEKIKIREWTEKRGAWRTEWWLATANGPQSTSTLLGHSVCVCVCNNTAPEVPENLATWAHMPPEPHTGSSTYYAGQGCVLQRWEPSVGLVRGLHMVELTCTFWSCRQIALVEIRPDGKMENKNSKIENWCGSCS